MKIFFDTEFTGLHKNTTLISIGLVDEDDNAFYAEFSDYDVSQCDDWINENVIRNLILSNNPYKINSATKKDNAIYVYGTKEYIKNKLKRWLSNYNTVELVSDVCHYDMMLFIDIFGGAFDLPKNVNPACHDINQDIANYYKISELEAFDKSREQILDEYTQTIDGRKHNSLYDAIVIKKIYYIVTKLSYNDSENTFTKLHNFIIKNLDIK